MKTNDFKILIKQAVKEAIQEELKDILLEAIRSPKTIVTETLQDTYAQPQIPTPKTLTPIERREMFSGILGEIKKGGTINSQYANEFKPQSIDTINNALPPGEVGLDMIMDLMNK